MIDFTFEKQYGGPVVCLSRDYTEDSFKANFRLLANGTDVTSNLPSGVTINDSRTSITDFSQTPPQPVQPGLKLTGYYIEDGYFYLVFVGSVGGSEGDYTVGAVENTGQFFDASNVNPVDDTGNYWELSGENTLKRGMGPDPRPNAGSPQSPISLPSDATLTANPNDSLGIQSFPTPAVKTSVSGTGSINYSLSSPQTGVVFEAKFDFVKSSDSSSATRACGPAAPTVTATQVATQLM